MLRTEGRTSCKPVPVFSCVETGAEKAGGWANDAKTILSSYAAASASEADEMLRTEGRTSC
jgi:hypothetical protein